MSEEFKCPICSKPTAHKFGNYNKYGLCSEHSTQQKNGEIKQCPDCGKWHKTGEICECKSHNKKPKSNSEELTCIICGKPSNGKHFCIDCWNKYHEKVLYIQVKGCKDFTKLNAEYESELTCEDGHMVKSPYEKIIDNWLYSEGIKHAYEKKIDISEKQDLTPDFFIPEYKGIKNIYIEFWGYGEENIKYQKIKEFKTNIYPKLAKEQNIAVVYLSKKEVDNDSYKKKIKYAVQGQIKE